jgi:hypothetical protein
MAYRDIATVQIALQTAGVTAQGFGTPLFASAHRYFPERVRTYSSLEEAANDLPTSSNAYQGVEAFFSNTPRPSTIKVGRRTASLTLTVAVGSTSGSVDVSATDGTDTFTVNVSVTGQVDEDAVASAIATAIEADPDVGPLVVAASSTNTVTVDVAAPTNEFWIANMSDNLSDSYTTSETAANLIAALSEADDDYYFFTADDHTEAFVLSASEAIEARVKMYFFSTDEQNALTPYSAGSATDILGQIRDAARFRTKGFFHHQADTQFPECSYVGYQAPFQAGSITWTNLQLGGVPISQDPSTGTALSTTQRGYLEDRNAAYVESIGGVNVQRNGRTAQGEPIDNIRGRDNLQVDLDVAYTNLLIGQQGGKIPYNAPGIAQLEGVCRNVLTQYVARNFINPEFRVTFPTTGIPTEDRQARVYRLGTFEAELTGAIELVDLFGVLTLDLS